MAAILLLSCSPAALHAEPSLSELAAEIQALKADNQRMKAENRQMKEAIADLHGETRRTRDKVREVASRGPGYALPPPVAPLPLGTVPAFVTADKKLQFGAITITPGGFLAAESVFRSKTTQSDINTGFGNIPLNNTASGHLNEDRITGRQSRAALLAEAAISPNFLASGYYEFDFLGAGVTSNATDTNSYAPRIRQLYAGLDMNEYGLHFLGGQMWSLLTLNSKGITPRNEVPPPTIDGQFLPGFTFARQAGIRLTKDFDKKLWLSLAAEEAQTTFGGLTGCTGASLTGSSNTPVIVPVPGGNSIVCADTGSGAGFSQYGQPYSFNHVPDVIGKIAYEARFADRDIHLEAEGVYKDLYDRSYSTTAAGAPIAGTGVTHNAAGYGVGGGLIVPVIPKKFDFQGSVLAGRGIGRYGAGLLPDATAAADGSLKPLPEIQALAGVTLHATPAIDIYAFAGLEKVERSFFQNSAGTLFGYGVPNANDSGCATELGTCAGVTKGLYQLTGGFWDKLYKGNFGEVRVGAQYSFTRRELFSTPAAAGATAVAFNPKSDEHMVFTSLRYYPFQ